jgi:hypothetical protein
MMTPRAASELALPLILASIVGVVVALFGSIAFVARRRPGAG